MQSLRSWLSCVLFAALSLIASGVGGALPLGSVGWAPEAAARLAALALPDAPGAEGQGAEGQGAEGQGAPAGREGTTARAFELDLYRGRIDAGGERLREPFDPQLWEQQRADAAQLASGEGDTRGGALRRVGDLWGLPPSLWAFSLERATLATRVGSNARAGGAFEQVLGAEWARAPPVG